MKFSKATKLSAIIMTFVLVLGLVACSADKTEKKKSNVDIKTLMAQEPNDADEAAKLYDKLLQTENDILSNNYHKIKTYGQGAEYSQSEWQQFIQQLIHLGYLDIAYDEKNALKISALGKSVLFDNHEVPLVKLSDIKQRKEAQKEAKLNLYK